MPRHGRGGPTGPRWSCRLELGRLLIGALGMAIFALAQLARAAPSFNPVYVDDRAQNYLMQFGYLPESGFETGNLRTDEQLRDAIRSLQRFGGVPETGIVDDRTRQLMSSRRCGLKDKPDLRLDDPDFLRRYKRFTLHGSPWKHHNLTWSLRTERPSGLDTGGVRRELSRALDLWAKNSKLTFKEINSDTADILVFFHRGYHGDGYPFDGRGQILAHAFFPGHDRGGDAHFDEEEEWTLGNNESDDGTSLFAVAAHEFGHSLGLAHSSVPGALMYPWYQGITKDYELPDDDKHGIQQMYGAPDRLWGKNPDYPGYRPGHPRPASPASTTSTTTTASTTSTTSPRPWPPRERPYRPNHYPEDRPRRPHHYPEERPHRPNHYPEDRPRNPYYPTKSDWPGRAPAPPTTTTTTTTTSRTTTWRTTTSTSTRRAYRPQPSIGTVGTSSPPPRHRPTLKKNLPDKCDTSYDAISLIRRELFIFKDKYVWRINDRGLVDGFPAEITQLFKFPMPVDHVDAVYERLHDNRIVFFVGRKFYVFNAFYLEPGYPQPLTALGLPAELPKIDAAMIWGHNKRTYFFSGDQYWRFDESVNHVELDYPRDIKVFAGVGRHIDAVFQWKNGTTYFFKDKHFWQFDDDYMRVAHKKPKSSAHYWMGCPPGLDTNDVDLESAANPRVDRISASGGATLAFASVPHLTIVAATLLSLLSLSSATWYT